MSEKDSVGVPSLSGSREGRTIRMGVGMDIALEEGAVKKADVVRAEDERKDAAQRGYHI